jgi:hypothetical protein
VVDLISLQGQVVGSRWPRPLCRLSHHIDAVLLVVGRIVGTPVSKASHEGLIIRAVVQIYQPLGAGAMLGGEHHEQGGDDAGAVDHGSFRFDEISLQDQGAISDRCSDSSPTDPCSRGERSAS